MAPEVGCYWEACGRGEVVFLFFVFFAEIDAHGPVSRVLPTWSHYVGIAVVMALVDGVMVMTVVMMHHRLQLHHINSSELQLNRNLNRRCAIHRNRNVVSHETKRKTNSIRVFTEISSSPRMPNITYLSRCTMAVQCFCPTPQLSLSDWWCQLLWFPLSWLQSSRFSSTSRPYSIELNARFP